ncbi:MAG: PLP-dependent transferase, partial [Pedobacter sp.]
LNYLKKHDQVESVIFPFDENFPQRELAMKQMKGACGLLTFIIKASSVTQIEDFCNTLQHILMAVSWGGHESLVIPKCAGMPPSDFDPANREHRMIRLYVGMEEPGYIIKDLEQAFEKVFNS